LRPDFLVPSFRGARKREPGISGFVEIANSPPSPRSVVLPKLGAAPALGAIVAVTLHR
jgi:hypothetical protein